jgi:c-di-GMP-binding flagellar brake protein YcgR
MIELGAYVTIKHFAVVTSIEDDIATIKPTKEFGVFNYFENDPVILAYEHEGDIYITECKILSMNVESSTINLRMLFNQLVTNHRRLKRYPVSLYANIKYEPRRTSVSYIRNIGVGGVAICAKNNLDIGQVVEIETYIADNVIVFNTEVVWRAKDSTGFEYGLKFLDLDNEKKQQLDKYIDILQKDVEASVKQLKQECKGMGLI